RHTRHSPAFPTRRSSDLIFSLDSVITAVGMVEHVSMMVTAIVIAIGFMLWLANPVADFIEEHPSVKMLALAFLILIGTLLVAESDRKSTRLNSSHVKISY